jgi:hypothetical protein
MCNSLKIEGEATIRGGGKEGEKEGGKEERQALR